MEQLTGYLQLEVEKKRDKTIAQNMYYYGAFKLMSPFYLMNDAQACYYIMNPGGGYVDGDRYKMEVALSNQAELLLTTQSATKIYKTPKQPVIQDIKFTLRDGSILEYIPDPIIGYRDSRFKQNTVIDMEKGTCLIICDIITSGWSADGEKFSYGLLDLKTEVYLDGKMVVLDHIRLSPDSQDIISIGLLEGYSHYGTMLVISDYVDSDFINMLNDLIEEKDFKCKIGLSKLNTDGFSIRVLGNSTQEVEKVFYMCNEIIRRDWFGKKPVFLRKY